MVSIKPSLQTQLSQQLTLTPQLQQSLQLLQLGAAEMSHELQQFVETNPLLEWDDNPTERGAPLSEAPLWNSRHSDGAERREWLENAGTEETSLRDHLLEQLHLSKLSARAHAIATILIEALDEDGYLYETLESIQNTAEREWENISLEEIEAIRHSIQRFDPLGVAARNLVECLLLQLPTGSCPSPLKATAETLLRQHQKLLRQRNFAAIRKEMSLSSAQLEQVLGCIKALDPKPGGRFQTLAIENRIPDLLVSRQQGKWCVALNKQPQLSINTHYQQLLRNSGEPQDGVFLRSRIQEANWLIHCLKQRQRTLFRVGQRIVKHQSRFFDEGAMAMQPLNIEHVALELDMHPSTVSRAVAHKYIDSPRGVLSLRYFFSSRSGGDSHNATASSATAIKSLLQQIIGKENRSQPLSDQKLVQSLSQHNIRIARRTVTKYRESLGILASHERRERP